MPAGSTASFVAGESRSARCLTIAGLTLLLGACAQSGNQDSLAALMGEKPEISDTTASGQPKSELQKATEYWGKEHAAKPGDSKAALAYAKNLKAMGQKDQAIAVLQQANVMNPADRGINSEYGRLALEQDHVSLAQKLLEQADDPMNPDWRTISARGTVLAKQGNYKDSIPFYQRALTLAPTQASVLNNLALAYTMDGQPEEAEKLLRQAATQPGGNPKVAQNLALVLGLQGKYDESKQVAGNVMPADAAASNATYLRQMVKLDPKVEPPMASADGKKSWSGQSVPLADKLLAQAMIAEAKAEASGTSNAAAAKPAQGQKSKISKGPALRGTAQPVAEAATDAPQVATTDAAQPFPLKPAAQ
jgi:Flp pilus assembly protein TadD